MSYAFLESIKVGPFVLRNRIIKAAMAEYICNEDGTISDAFVEYYRNIAKGGASLIIPGISVSDPCDRLGAKIFKGDKNPHLYDKKFLPGLKKVVNAVHNEGSLIMFQLWNSGSKITDKGLVSLVNDYTLQDLAEIKDYFIKSARIVKESGADGVEVHVAHTYLLSQFLSPKFNKRTDQYGCQTIENATRFATEIMDEIKRELCDDQFCMILKLNGMDDFEADGISLDWATQAAQIFEKAGAQLITVNGGGALVGYQYMSDNGQQPEGWKVHIAHEIKKKTSIPIAASGSIRNPNYAHQIITDGRCDVIAMGRTLLADPEWTKKASEAREDEIRPCISCLYCFTKIPEDGSVSGCAVNPYCKTELKQPKMIKDGRGRSVVVVGAGPSGLEAARVLAEREFDVSIYDKKPYLGGLVDLAAVPPHKSKFRWLIDYYSQQLRRLKVKVTLNTEVDESLLEKLNPYAIVLATGTNELVPRSIPGISNDNVINVRDVFENRLRIVDKKVTVIGGGMTGTEAAYYLSLRNNDVTVVEMMEKKKMSIPDNISHISSKAQGVNYRFSTQLVSIGDKEVVVKDLSTDVTDSVETDIVILAMGIRQNKELEANIESKFQVVKTVGDCYELGTIPTGIRSGADEALNIK